MREKRSSRGNGKCRQEVKMCLAVWLAEGEQGSRRGIGKRVDKSVSEHYGIPLEFQTENNNLSCGGGCGQAKGCKGRTKGGRSAKWLSLSSRKLF